MARSRLRPMSRQQAARRQLGYSEPQHGSVNLGRFAVLFECDSLPAWVYGGRKGCLTRAAQLNEHCPCVLKLLRHRKRRRIVDTMGGRLARPPKCASSLGQEIIGEPECFWSVDVHVYKVRRRRPKQHANVLGSTVEMSGNARLDEAEVLPTRKARRFAAMRDRDRRPSAQEVSTSCLCRSHHSTPVRRGTIPSRRMRSISAWGILTARRVGRQTLIRRWRINLRTVEGRRASRSAASSTR